LRNARLTMPLRRLLIFGCYQDRTLSMGPGMLKRFWSDRDGATAIEYGLIVSLIAIGVLSALTATSGNVTTMWSSNEEKISEALSQNP